MKKIDKTAFKEYIKLLNFDDVVPPIEDHFIHEFTIGKNYFYNIHDNPPLKQAQINFNNFFQTNVELNNAAVAYRRNYSYLHLFEPHKKNQHFVRLDIKSFFHSIDVKHMREIFKHYFVNEEELSKSRKSEAYFNEEKKQTLLDAFINLTTYIVPESSPNENFRGKQIVPVGFITSPIISNIIFRKIDIQIQKFCYDYDIIYTRYADDMLFSCSKDQDFIFSESFINEIKILISQLNLKLNSKKTIKSKHTISLNGYTIQYSEFIKEGDYVREQITNELRFSNKRIDLIKKMIYMRKVQKKSSDEILKKLFKFELKKLKLKYPLWEYYNIQKYNHSQLLNKITGYRSYLLSIVKFNQTHNCTSDQTIKKYIDIVDELDTIIEEISIKIKTL